ncbi:MAG: 30S ribosomal protein S13, partial [Desulfurococcaceae archaeon]
MEREFRRIVRILETDVDGRLPLVQGLAAIKGVGYNFGLGVCRVLGLDPSMKTGYLTDNEIKSLESVVKEPIKYNIPVWLYNRRKDRSIGNDLHYTSASLLFYVKEDIEHE